MNCKALQTAEVDGALYKTFIIIIIIIIIIIPSILQQLHRLPIRRRALYKLCMLVYNCLHRTVSSYQGLVWTVLGRTFQNSSNAGYGTPDFAKPMNRD